MERNRQDGHEAAFFALRRHEPTGAALPEISIVAPMYNEAGGAVSLVEEIAEALGAAAHEIIIVDDGSTDETHAALRAAQEAHPQLRIITHGQNAGQSRALRTGVLAAKAEIIATLGNHRHPGRRRSK